MKLVIKAYADNLKGTVDRGLNLVKLHAVFILKMLFGLHKQSFLFTFTVHQNNNIQSIPIRVVIFC